MKSAFSLTPDPRFYFRSRSHGRVFDALSAAIKRRETLMLVMGDLGVGKTTLCKTLLDSQERRSRAALAGNALLSPEDLLRLMLQDLGAVTRDEVKQGRLVSTTRQELVEMFDRFLGQLRATSGGAVMIVDEAHSLPRATKEQIVEIATLDSNRDRILQFLLAGQPAIGGGALFPELDGERRGVRARLLPLERDECEPYIAHRLAIAGFSSVAFAATTVDVVYRLSGGVPRLVNLLCERGLQEAADVQARMVEPAMIESAASALDLIRLKPRRFRWYGSK
ncbi:MAG TPA: AAA family ATPase [Vicinamibacterales bacterium]|nr:AAA family ATPase [Vicinamibacterales bacterium]